VVAVDACEEVDLRKESRATRYANGERCLTKLDVGSLVAAWQASGVAEASVRVRWALAPSGKRESHR
jgi:hypothetical protein